MSHNVMLGIRSILIKTSEFKLDIMYWITVVVGKMETSR